MDLEARLDLVIEIINFGLHKEKPVSFSGPIAILVLQSSFRCYLALLRNIFSVIQL